MQLKNQPIKADTTEVFYANKLCRFDLESSKKRLEEITKKQLKQELEKKSEKIL